MAIQKFIAVENSTIYDVCLNTYGTLDQLGKLIQDNPTTAQMYPVAGAVFVWDDTLQISQTNAIKGGSGMFVGMKYATKHGDEPTANFAPQNVVAPQLSGTIVVGQTLTCLPGVWAGLPLPTIAYQWQRSNDGGNTWADIVGEIATTYTLQTGDDAYLIRCQETATNPLDVAYKGSNAITPYAAGGGGGSAPYNTTAPVISGTTTLTTTNGSWSGTSPITFTYQWLKNGVAILGATANSYIPVSGDIGQNIQCRVVATNAIGSANQVSNVIVPKSIPTIQTNPIVSGGYLVGDTLSTTDGIWLAYPAPTYDYNWQYSTNGGSTWNNYSPAQTLNTYTIVSGDLTRLIRCQVKATNTEGNNTANSNTVLVAQAPQNTVLPALSGNLQVGQVLTTTNGTWTGTATITYTYQWKRNGNNISGANSQTYTIVTADIGTNITCRVTATNIVTGVSVESASVTPVGAPVAVQAPAVYGSYSLGATLTVQDGTYSGFPSATITRQWQISTNGGSTWNNYSPAQTGTTYTVVSGDVGNQIRVFETATNTEGTTTQTSNVATIASGGGTQRPENTVAPAITANVPSNTGDFYIGQVLSCSQGTWLNSPTGYAYQWYRNGVAISGATSSSYTLATNATSSLADEGKDITCIVTATNSGGSEPQISNSIYAMDATYFAVLSRAFVLSYARPNDTQNRHFNQMLIDLKLGGFWSLMDVFYWFANNGSAGFGRLNWVTPANFECTAVNAPSWVSNSGYSFNSASSQYLDTNFNPATSGVNYTQNNAGRYAYAERTNSTNNQRIDGNNLGLSDNCMIISTSNTANSINSGTTLPATSAVTNQTNLHSIIRTSSTAVTRYYDFNVAINATSSGVPNSNQWLGRSLTTHSSYRIRFYAMGGAIASGDYASFKAIIDKYMNSLP